MAIFAAMGWINPATIAVARGEKAVGNFDEDSLTMAVSAGMDCMRGIDIERTDAVYFATTTAPFKERLNANIIAGALGMREDVRSTDFTASRKAGTSALLSALEFAASGSGSRVLVCSSDQRLGKAGSLQEMLFGDAAAAILVGEGEVIAEFKGFSSTAHDFVDHIRGSNSNFDRMWEERWIREMGYGRLIGEAVERVCAKLSMSPSEFDKVVFPCPYGSTRKRINQKMGFKEGADQDDLLTTVGESGSAHPLLMLAKTLEDACPGEKILLIGYGNGCDALVFEVTEAITTLKKNRGVTRWIKRRAELDNYMKYAVWRRMLPADMGMRGEFDLETRWSLIWRERKPMLGLYAGSCKACGMQQFPPERICANPECGALDQMELVYLANKGGRIFSYTGDMLAASYDPPAAYGNVELMGGGKMLMDFTDCTADELQVGMPVEFTFRIKLYDPKRDVTNYFWKAVPAMEEVG